MDHPVRVRRLAKGFSQGRLSVLSSVSGTAISLIENRVRRGRPETLKKLAGPLGVKDWRKLQED